MKISFIISTCWKKMAAKQIIEFFGLPGAGKTSQAVSPVLIRRKLSCWFFDSLFLWRHPFNFIYLYRLLIRESKFNRSLLSHKKHLFSLSLAKEMKAQLSFHDSAIDDGLLQFLLSLYERKITELEAKALLNCIDKNRIIAIVEASESQRLAWMKKRGRIPRFFLGEDYLTSWSLILNYNYQIFKNILLQDFSVKIIKNEENCSHN